MGPATVIPEGRQNDRPRPRWATRIRHLGEDLTWALRGWVDLPRPLVRALTATVAGLVAVAAGVDDRIARFLDAIGG